MVHRKMSDDYGQDTVPVKDVPEHSRKGSTHETKDDIVQQRRVVFKLAREDLEDRFLHLCEENLLLKRHASKQEDRIKKMATKLIRLINDHKKQEPGGVLSRKRDLETEELIEDMQDKIREFERQNVLLKEKLVAAKQQLVMHTKRITPYPHSHVNKRHNTRHPKTAVGRHSYSKEASGAYSPQAADSGDSSPRGGLSPQEGGRVPGHASRSHHDHGRNPFRRGNEHEQRRHHTHWDDSRHHNNDNADEVIAKLKEQLEMFDAEIETLKNQLHKEQETHEEELLALKAQVTQSHRQNVQENVELIKLQRETKQTNDKMASLLEQYNKLQQNYHVLKGSHEQLLREIDNLSAQLKEEQRRGFSLQTEVQSGAANNLVIAEFKEQIAALQKENSLIRESNAKLMNSTFNVERDRLLYNNESSLKIQVAQLEATLKADLEEKNILLTKLTLQKDDYSKLEEEMRKLQAAYYHTKEEHDQLREKLGSLSQEGTVNFVELEQALLLVRQSRDGNVSSMEFLQKSTDADKSLQQQFQELEIDHAETVNELAKIRSMLQLQSKINNDYKDEIELMRRRMKQMEQETTERIEEYSRLLDVRADHVKQLEEQLKDMMAQKILLTPPSTREVYKGEDEVDTPFSLKGRHILEIHMKQVILNKERVHVAEGETPALFLTWAFYNFESTNSGILKSMRPEFRKTVQYEIDVDKPLLRYLHKEEMVVNLYQALGVEYQPLASARVRFRELLDVTHGRLNGSVPLIGYNPNEGSIVMGSLEYWVAFKNPADGAEDWYEVSSASLPILDTIQNIADDALRTLQKKNSSMTVPSPDEIASSTTTIEIGESAVGSPSSGPVPRPRKAKEDEVVRSSASEPIMSSTPTKHIVHEKPPIAPRSSNAKLSKQPSTSSSNEMKSQNKSLGELERTLLSEGVDEDQENYSDDDENQDASSDESSKENSSDPGTKDESPSTGDSEDVVTPTRGVSEELNRVVIEVNHLTIKDGASVLSNPNIQMLFVEYRFLGYPPEELETPFALPKPKPNQSIAFNFHKVFYVDPQNNYKKRQFLASMLLPNSPDHGKIMFTVVSEPPEEMQDLDCEEVGYAYVDLHSILKGNEDLVNYNATVFAASNENLIIGFLNVSVEILDVLKMVNDEISRS